jgi:DNA-binding NarL/FixJ family response regulator
MPCSRFVSGRRKLEMLTDQERRGLQEMAAGYSNAGIARALSLSSRTVEDYCARIFDKLRIDEGLDVNRRVSAVLQDLRNS